MHAEAKGRHVSVWPDEYKYERLATCAMLQSCATCTLARSMHVLELEYACAHTQQFARWAIA